MTNWNFKGSGHNRSVINMRMYSILAGKGLMEGQRRKLQLQEQQRLLQLLEDHSLQENVVVR